jgi:DNA primase
MGLEQLLHRTGNKIDEELWFDELSREAPRIDLSRSTERWTRTGATDYNQYLKDRGVSLKACEDYEITVSHEGDRIFFPVTDLNGKTVGRISRSTFQTSGTRYIKVGEQTPVWPMHQLRNLCHEEYIIVTEGLFSCLRIASVSSTFEVFSLAGAKANKKIVAALASFNPIFIYDRDRAGISAAKRMKSFRPDWTVLTAKVAPDDMLKDSQIEELVTKLLNLGVDKV